jgi:hypothetical protein
MPKIRARIAMQGDSIRTRSPASREPGRRIPLSPTSVSAKLLLRGESDSNRVEFRKGEINSLLQC